MSIVILTKVGVSLNIREIPTQAEDFGYLKKQE